MNHDINNTEQESQPHSAQGRRATISREDLITAALKLVGLT